MIRKFAYPLLLVAAGILLGAFLMSIHVREPAEERVIVKEASGLSCWGFDWCMSDTLEQTMRISMQPAFSEGCSFFAYKDRSGWHTDSSFQIALELNYDSLSHHVQGGRPPDSSLVINDGASPKVSIIDHKKHAFASLEGVEIQAVFDKVNWRCDQR